MPVPVPSYSRLPAHPATKPSYRVCRRPLSSSSDFALDCAFKDVIHGSSRQPSAELGLRADPLQPQPSWRVNISQFSSEDIDAHATVLPQGSQAARGCSHLHNGLNIANSAVASKQRHAEVYHSSVDVPEIGYYSGMGLQAQGDYSRSSKSSWSGYDADDDVCAIQIATNAYGVVPNHRQGHEANMSSRATMSSSGGFVVHGGQVTALQHEDTLTEEQSRGGAVASLQVETTPFEEYVDRIVAGDATIQSDHFVIDPQNSLPPVETPRCKQQPPTSEPVTDSSYIKAYRTTAEPLSEWVADYVWKVCTTGMSLPARFVKSSTTQHYPENPPSELAKSIRTMLCSTLLQPSGIVLALWYIARLPVVLDRQASEGDFLKSEREFRTELLGERHHITAIGERDSAEASAPFRVIVLGCMLANKWLDDHTFSNKTWHAVSELPVLGINRLEFLALSIFSHDLSVPSKAWGQWLSHLRQYQQSFSPYPAPIKRPSAMDANSIVRKMIDGLVQLQVVVEDKDMPHPVFSGLLDHGIEKPDSDPVNAVDPYEIDLDEDGPLREEYVPKRRTSCNSGRNDAHRRSASYDVGETMQISPDLPPPSVWSPQADPPIERERGNRDRYLAVQPLSYGATEQVSHVRSFSAEYVHHPAWWPQMSTTSSNESFMTRESRRNEAAVLQPVRIFQSLALGFPLSTVCPPISHTRSTLSPPAFAPESTSQPWTYSHSQNDMGGCVGSSFSCGHPPGYPLPIPHFHGDGAHFRPMWLRT